MDADQLEARVRALMAEGASLGQALTDTFPGTHVDLLTDPATGELTVGETFAAMPGLTVETWETVRDRMIC
jgi:hypothetical protein